MKTKSNKPIDRNQADRKRNEALNNPDKKTNGKKLPGDYPPREDIMNRMNTTRVGMDVENFSRTIGPENFNIHEPMITNPDDIQNDPLMPVDNRGINERNTMEQPVLNDLIDEDAELEDADVTEEDLQSLGPRDLSMDMGEDEQLLKNRVWPVDMAGKDLDVPGAELDDESEAIGSEDEENNSYSLGGDAHEDNLEGK